LSATDLKRNPVFGLVVGWCPACLFEDGNLSGKVMELGVVLDTPFAAIARRYTYK
jgi:hypothetical protein